jgi:excisionase family DNA binding protein
MNKKYYTMSEAADLKGVCRQAIHYAVKKGRMKAHKVDTYHWKIHKDDLQEYFDSRYDIMKRKKGGKVVFEEGSGYIPLSKAADLLDVPTQKLYYAIRTGKLKVKRIKGGYLIGVESLKSYEDNYLRKEKEIFRAS